jgi:hypothetical protein
MIVRQGLVAALFVLVAATGCSGGSQQPAPSATSSASAGVPASANATATTAGSRPVQPMLVVLDCSRTPQVRPTEYVIGCADANDRLTGLRWTTWGPGNAVGTGQESLNDCTPSCADGHLQSYAVTMTLSKLVVWSGRPNTTRFATLTLRYTGARPPGAGATRVDSLPG